MSFENQSRAVFGRREHEIWPVEAPRRQTARLARLAPLMALAFGMVILILGAAALVDWAWPALKASEADNAQAAQSVIEIVNRPITHLPRTPMAREFSPGWFHPGAIEPDFGAVDVRKSQELIYNGSTYVTSDVTPSEMFIGDELEFNAMTKYFYRNRTLPKKRLTEQEMLKINGLYRMIGRDERALILWRVATGGVLGIVLGIAVGPLLLIRRFKPARIPAPVRLAV